MTTKKKVTAKSGKRTFTKVENGQIEYFTPKKKGEMVEGTYKEIKEVDSKFKKKGQPEKQERIVITKEDGKDVMLPSHAVLNTAFDMLNVGDFVRITFEGKVKGKSGLAKKNGYNTYTVEVAD